MKRFTNNHIYCDTTYVICIEMFEKKVKIGFFISDGLHEAVPGVKRAVLQAVEVLKNKNYEVIAFPPPDIKVVWFLPPPDIKVV